MGRYSSERKAAVIKKLLPPFNYSPAEVARQEDIPYVTVYAWLKQVRMEGLPVPGAVKTSDDWSAEAKLAVVIETANLSEIDLSEYCRRKGIYVEQAKAWRHAALDGQLLAKNSRELDRQRTQSESKRIKALEKELARKEKALAEAAALLVLSKKAEAIWGKNEED